VPGEGSTGGAAGRSRGAHPLVSHLSAHRSNVAVIGGDVHGDLIFGGELRSPADDVIDFQPLIASATRGFVGRRDVFTALEAFRAGHARGYFEIVAAAGLGKTALAAEIAKRYDALAFFASEGRGLTQAKQFLTHICAALITRYALTYDHLPARAGDDSTFLGRLLEEAAVRSPAPVWIVVDALDEAEPSAPRANPLILPAHLPADVYIVVTHRPTGRLWTQPDTPRVPYELRADTLQQEADIEEYVRLRAIQDGPIKTALARTQPRVAPETFVRKLTAASRGNFMYVSYILGDIEARDPAATTLDLDRLPDGLQGYYEQFWSDMEQAKAEGWADWKGLYRPVVERLAVAAESVSAGWLAAQIGRDADEVRERALLRWARLLSRDELNGEESWRVVHRSFADFLEQKVDLAAAHRAVAAHYAIARWNRWDEFDDYGLRQTPLHLAAAAAAEPDAGKRHALTATLASLVLAPGYQQRHLTELRDPNAFERALDLALRRISLDDLASPADVAELALRLVAFRKEQRQPQPIFDLARDGDIEAAERRLDLFALEVDAAWYQALLLTISWLGAARSPQKARALRDRVQKSLAAAPASSTLDLLLARVGVTLDGTPAPVLSLPQPPTPEQAQALVGRLSSATVDRSLMSGPDIELMNLREPVGGSKGYLAEEDGPDLVAAALDAPTFGEPLLKQYVAVHAAYGYREYRQGSLWALLDAVLQHPSQEWVQAWVSALGAAVLAPNRGEFREALGLAALALQVTVGEPGAADTLKDRRTAAVQASQIAEPLPPRHLTVNPPARGQGDTWGTNRRRLAAVAEVLSRVPGQESAAPIVIQLAMRLRWGFAGFNAPACVALAEAIEVSSGDSAGIAQTLAGALTSAHNIQDATFCARTTARVQSMMARWWGAPEAAGFDVEDAAERLSRDPSSPEFAALHTVGQGYHDRDPMTTIPLPHEMLMAATLTQLAAVYRRPLDDFQRLNDDPRIQVDNPLAAGTRVDVPDPGFPPLLATRFAARALAHPVLSPERQQRIIRALVPIAAADATALDLVLARLLLAARSQDRAMLKTVAELAARSEAEALPDAALSAQLTRFVP
jgi:hypothetical protein